MGVVRRVGDGRCNVRLRRFPDGPPQWRRPGSQDPSQSLLLQHKSGQMVALCDALSRVM